MNKIARFTLGIIILYGLASCTAVYLPTPASVRTAIPTDYERVSLLLTYTPVATVQQTASPEPGGQARNATVVATVPGSTPSTVEPASTATPSPADAQTALVCDLAQPGRPIDITIPDDTRLSPGQAFSKTWRLVNAGHCEWTRDYMIVWFSGDDMGQSATQPLGVTVPAGGAVDITVDMTAPEQPGTYQSNWKLRSAAGELFGIGPSGGAPFWVRVVVVQVDTPTVTPTIPPPPTETPSIYASGRLTLLLNDFADLDTGEVRDEKDVDLLLEQPVGAAPWLAPQNGALINTAGANMPGLLECSQAVLSDTPLALDQLATGTYLCYQTGAGLPGRALLTAFDAETGQVSLEFLTWAVP